MKLKKSLSIVLSIFSNVLVIFAIILIILNLFFIFNSKIRKDFIPDIFGYKFLIDMSDSMKPVIDRYDLIIIKENKDYDISDIVCYVDKDGILITHRIVDIVDSDDEVLFKMKGDNNSISDSELVSKENIEGKFVTRIKKIGRFILFLTTPIGILVFFLILVALCLFEYLISKFKNDIN